MALLRQCLEQLRSRQESKGSPTLLTPIQCSASRANQVVTAPGEASSPLGHRPRGLWSTEARPIPPGG
jgi:hypothetical protein